MAPLLLWVVSSVIVAWVMRRHPLRAIGIALFLWAMVPSVATPLLTGQTSGPLALHPAAWLIFTIVLIQLLRSGQTMLLATSRHIYVALCVTVFCLGALVTSRLSGSGGLALLANQIVAPAMIFWLITAFGPQRPQGLLELRNILLGLVALQSILATVQAQVGEVLFYEKFYVTLYWFDPLTFQRGMGTTDGPLTLSLAISVVAPLTLGLQQNWWRFTLLGVFVVGAISTQSRTGVLAMCIVLLFILVRSQMSSMMRILYASLLAVAGYVVATSTLVTGISSRLSNDTGSAEARGLAVRFFADRWTDFLFVGDGLTSNYRVASEYGLHTSLESSFLMYAVDTGLVLAVLYFGLQAALVIRYGGQTLLPGATLGLAIGLVAQNTFSALAGSNLDGPVVWTVLGMVVAAAHVKAMSQKTTNTVTSTEGDLAWTPQPQLSLSGSPAGYLPPKHS